MLMKRCNLNKCRFGYYYVRLSVQPLKIDSCNRFLALISKFLKYYSLGSIRNWTACLLASVVLLFHDDAIYLDRRFKLELMIIKLLIIDYSFILTDNSLVYRYHSFLT